MISPPSDNKAERALIGACLVSESAFRQAEGVAPEDFESPAHSACWGAMLKCAAGHQVADPLTVGAHMREMGWRDVCGDDVETWLLGMASGDHFAANASQYAEKVQVMGAVRRAAFELTALDSQLGNVATVDGLTAMASEYQRVSGILGTSGAATLTPLSQQVQSASDILARRAAQNGMPEIPTGFAKMDKYTTGWVPGSLNCVGARPGAGKTALLMHYARVAMDVGIPVLMFSLEMSAEQVVFREIAAMTGIPVTEQAQSLASRAGEVSAAFAAISEMPLTIRDVDRPADLLCADARRWRETVRDSQHALVLLDYVQICRPPLAARARDENSAVTAVVREFKRLGKEIGGAVIVASQLNRSGMDGIPSLRELRGSGSIEQESDVIVMPHRDQGEFDKVDPNVLMSTPGQVGLILAKNKWGPTGTIPAHWTPETMTFKEQEW